MDGFDRVVALGVALVAGASFLDWYGITWAVGTSGTASSSATAWTASTIWSLGVVLALAAAGTWLRYRRTAGPAVHGPTLVALGVSGALLLVPWLTALASMTLAPPAEDTVVSIAVYDPPTVDPVDAIGRIYRDDVFLYHTRGYDADVRYGLFVTLALVALLAVAVAAARVRDLSTPGRT